MSYSIEKAIEIFENMFEIENEYSCGGDAWINFLLNIGGTHLCPDTDNKFVSTFDLYTALNVPVHLYIGTSLLPINRDQAKRIIRRRVKDFGFWPEFVKEHSGVYTEQLIKAFCNIKQPMPEMGN